MTKEIKLFATLRDLVQAKKIEVELSDGQTVAELLETIRGSYPELIDEILTPDGELTGLVHILVHGRNIYWLDGLQTRVKSSDILVFMPPSAGG